MTKIALLVGVSDYDSGLAPLRGTLTDIEAMNRVLASKDIGQFDQVKSLPNPDFSTLHREIEILFTEDRHEDDLVVLYFSGHGLKDKDENGSLYFAARDTQFTPQRQLRTYSAVSAQFIQQCMNRSCSKRLVFILDCCFSGAFAKDWKMKAAEMPVNLEAQLGGEGRAVLTSSTSTQLSYEDQGASIYTRYLVEGIETGAADRNEDGAITIDELHQYAKEKVQEAAPAMRPEIYAVQEGYTIRFVKAPLGDPKLAYRKEVESLAKKRDGQLNVVDLANLEYTWQDQLKLTKPEATQIEDQVLQPYREFRQRCEKFEQVLRQALQSSPTLTRDLVESLRDYQQKLKLRNEDIAPITRRLQIDLDAPIVEPTPSVEPVPPPTPSPVRPVQPIVSLSLQPIAAPRQAPHANPPRNLSSSRSKSPITLSTSQTNGLSRRRFLVLAGLGGVGLISTIAIGQLSSESPQSVEPSPDPPLPEPSTVAFDYSKLESLLQAGNFKDADQETLNLMRKATNRESDGWLDSESLGNFPCDVLSQLDQLWVNNSDGKFGFSVQQKIWQELGSPTEYNEQWEAFGDRVGWRKNGKWIPYSEVTFDTTALEAHLPLLPRAFRVWGGWGFLFSRAATCRL